MKKLIALVLALLCLGLSSCKFDEVTGLEDGDKGDNTDGTETTSSKQPNNFGLQDISVSVAEAGGGHTFELEKTDAKTISQILSADSWVADSTDCLSDYIVTLDGRTIYYHSDCGTFNERLDQSHQSLHLSETDREIVNAIINGVIFHELNPNAPAVTSSQLI